MTIDTTTLAATLGTGPLTKSDVERAVRDLARRKAYNKRPDVRASRQRYNQRRQETVKLALQAYRRQQEGVK